MAPAQSQIGSLCTGYGGLDMAVRAVLGGRLAWWSDIVLGPIAVMRRHHPHVPNIGDVSTVDWTAVPPVDIVTAGYPCQPFSQAGKRLGTQDPRHIWPHIARGIGVLRPRLVVLENVPGHIRRGLDVVIGDLATLGYDAVWTTVRASDVGAPHRRERLFVLAADTSRECGAGGRDIWPDRGPEHSDGDCTAADPMRGGRGRDEGDPGWSPLERAAADGDSSGRLERWGVHASAVRRWERRLGRPVPEPTIAGTRRARVLSPHLVEWMMGLEEGRVTGVPGLSREQQLRLLGNGVVPQQAEHALRSLLALVREVAAVEGVSLIRY